jgi:hypothetical protein
MRHVYDARHGEYLPARIFEGPRQGVPSPLWDILYEPEWNEDATADEHADAVRYFAREKGLDTNEVDDLLAEIGEDVSWSILIIVDDDARPAAFEDLLARVSAEPHGDDDTFDYWPSGVKLANALAPDEQARERLRAVVREVLDGKGLAPIDANLDDVLAPTGAAPTGGTFVAIIVDGGMWSDPAVFGPFTSEQDAVAYAQREGAIDHDDAGDDPFAAVYVIREVAQPRAE